MAAARGVKPLEVLNANRLAALRQAGKGGVASVKRLLEQAQADLEKRLKALGGPQDSFTAVQMGTALEQVRQLLRDVKRGLGTTVVDVTRATAMTAARGTVEYVRASDAAYRGLGRRGLAINEAMVFDRAANGAESSILHRILTDPEHPGQRGVLDRYGDAVVEKFEQTLANRFVTGKPWAEVRAELVEQSPFLQGAPLSWAERILRTETMYAHGRASLDSMQAIDEQVGGGSVKILCASFDNRTSADSYAVHGQIRRLAEPFDWWGGKYMNPPNRPNDREVVLPHRVEWPIPPGLEPKSDGEVAAAWARDGRKGAVPPRPNLSTVPRELFGKEQPQQVAAAKEEVASPAPPKPDPLPPPARAPKGREREEVTSELADMRMLTEAESRYLGGMREKDGQLDLGDLSQRPVRYADRDTPTMLGIDPDVVDRLGEVLEALAKAEKSAPVTGYITLGVDVPLSKDAVKAALQQARPGEPVFVRMADRSLVLVRGGAEYTAQLVRGVAAGAPVPATAKVIEYDALLGRLYAGSPMRPPGAISLDPPAMLTRDGGAVDAGARLLLDEAMMGAGYRPRSGKMRVDMPPDSMGANVAGHALPNGDIEILREYSEKAARFASAPEREPRSVRSRDAARLVQDAQAFSAIVHEEIHQCSPIMANAYFAHGAALEEVCTELLARRYTDELLRRRGVQPSESMEAIGARGTLTDVVGGAYQRIVDEYAEAVAEAMGVPMGKRLPEGRRRIQEAADRIWRKRRGVNRIATADEYLGEFLDALELPIETDVRALRERLRRTRRDMT